MRFQPAVFFFGGRGTGRDGGGLMPREGEKYNLLHEGFSKLEAPHMVVLVCLTQGVGTYIYREKNSPHLHQLTIWY